MDSVASHAAASSAQTGHQQFCLRWHNHQTSLLSSLPLLLDQSHLTDVTLSADGRTIRAHRVVLSACSVFFSELFRTLEPPFHPVVILPGTSFTALVALLTFMYSGEVNVYEEQISSLLSLAETLGIKGLADFNGNISKTPPKESPSKDSDSPLVMTKLSPLDSLFVKPFHFYASHSMPQPLNFSQNSSRNNENNFYKNQNHTKCHPEQQNHLDNLTAAHSNTTSTLAHNDTENISNNNNNNNNNNNSKNNNNNNSKNNGNSSCNISSNNSSNNNRKGSGNDVKRKQISDMRKIDKIAENLRCGTSGKNYYDQHQPKMTHLIPQSPPTSLILKPPPQVPLPPPFNPHTFMPDDLLPKTPESLSLMDIPQSSVTPTFFSNEALKSENMLEKSMTAVAPKPGNSKLYATCFICHKQLSNQYNLRVHLETHQNVRYACTVCTHVSRSKDALRKHVSYRHPGTPSPCDSETRRKRTKHNNNNVHIKQELMDSSSSLQQALAGTTAPHTPTPPIQCIPDINTSAGAATAPPIKTTSTESA